MMLKHAAWFSRHVPSPAMIADLADYQIIQVDPHIRKSSGNYELLCYNTRTARVLPTLRRPLTDYTNGTRAMADQNHTTSPKKRCTQCGEYYPRTPEYFHRDKTKCDGLYSWCKDCKRKKDRAWGAANREHKSEHNRVWREANTERVREHNRVWREANQEYRRAYQHTWRAANIERTRENERAWAAANPERKRISKQNRLARERSLPNTFTVEQHRFALEYWHGCCSYCGRQFRDLFGERTLSLDHYIPLSNPGCPGTTAGNMLPVCHGGDGCNNSKGDADPRDWLVRRFGKRKARKILARIEAYFEVVRSVFDSTNNKETI